MEEEVDPATGLPRVFSRQRVAMVAAANRNAPQNAVAVVRAGHLIDTDDTAGARPAFAEAVAAAPRNANWLLSLATLEEQTGDYGSAVRVYQDLLTIQPANVIALNNAAFALAVHLGKPSEALPLAKRAAALTPNVGSVIDTLAWTDICGQRQCRGEAPRRRDSPGAAGARHSPARPQLYSRRSAFARKPRHNWNKRCGSTRGSKRTMRSGRSARAF